MLYNILLIICFIAVVLALWSGFFFMMKDRGRRKRMVYALFARVGFSALLVLLILYGYYSGHLSLSFPF